MNFFAAISLGACLSSIFLGAVVLGRNPRSRLNLLFALFSFLVAYWGLTEFGYRQAESYRTAFFWLKLSNLCPLLIPLFLHFAVEFSEQKKTFVKWIVLPFSYIIALLFIIIDLPTNAVTGLPIRAAWGWTYKPPKDLWYTLNAIWTIATLGLVVFIGPLQMLTSPEIVRRRQAQWVVFGFFLPVMLGGIDEILAPFAKIEIPELTTLGFFIADIVVAIAIWRYKLFTLTAGMAADRIVETMSDALLLIRTDGIIAESNRSSQHLFRCVNDSLSGKFMEKFIEDSHHMLTRVLDPEKAFDNKTVHDLEATIIAFDGIRIPVSISSAAMFDSQKTLLGFVVILRDISERIASRKALEHARDELEDRVAARTMELSKTNLELEHELIERVKTQQALFDEKERLAVTLRSIGDGVITADTCGAITLMNEVAENLTGWKLRDALGENIFKVLVIVDAVSRLPITDLIGSVLSENTTKELPANTLLIAKDCTERRIADSISPIRDGHGAIAGVVLVFRDITEKFHHEEEMLKAKKIESVGLLAGGIAHDFNNLLTGIINNLFIAKIDLSPQGQTYESLMEAETIAFRASKLTKRLLTFSQGGDPVKIPTSIASLIEDSIGFYLSGSKVDYEIRISEDLFCAEVDNGQIDQVLHSLVSNAEQAMPDGGTVEVSAVNTCVGIEGITGDNDSVLSSRLSSGWYIKISIQDQGKGIPQDHLDRIFDPYFTTKTSTSGLGLSIAYTIVDKHGGHIAVESEVDKGSVFHVYLPAQANALVESENLVEQDARSNKINILLMDDEAMIREATALLLTKLGFSVSTATHGEEALRIYDESFDSEAPFDVVILDLTVQGGMGGKECMLHLLKINPSIKAIVSSGYSNDQVLSEFRIYGFKGVLPKPYTIEQLTNTIRTVIAAD